MLPHLNRSPIQQFHAHREDTGGQKRSHNNEIKLTIITIILNYQSDETKRPKEPNTTAQYHTDFIGQRRQPISCLLPLLSCCRIRNFLKSTSQPRTMTMERGQDKQELTLENNINIKKG